MENRHKILAEQIIDTGLKLLEKGLVSRSFGNISCKLNDNFMLITPSGRKYTELDISDIVKVNFHNLEFEGQIKPSSELKLHAAVYRHRPEINSVIHTHQQHATTLAVAHKKLDAIIDDQAQLIGPNVKVADYAPSSSNELVENLIKALDGRMAAMMANHGAVCLGRQLDEAFTVSEVLEKASKVFIEASILGGAIPLDKAEAIKLHEEYLNKYSKMNEENR